MRLMLTAGLGAACLAFGLAARADAEIPRCPAPFKKILGDEVFNNYRVRASVPAPQPAAPLVARGAAHLYRTALTEAAKEGPNFADHYTVVRIGCGAATACVAIIDAKTGAVYFPPELKTATSLMMYTDPSNIETLNYRRNSRLLVVVGTANEDPITEGVSYYIWRSEKLTRFRFMPRADLCTLPLTAPF